MVFVKGYKMSEEHKRKIGNANKNKVHTKEQNSSHSKVMTGRKASIETRQRMAEARRGKPLSEAVKKKISQSSMGKPGTNTGKFGSLAPRWQGGKTPKAKLVRMSLEIKQWREKVFERDNYTCQVCSVYGGHLHADHIKPFASFPELRLSVENGRTLCRPCHYYVTYKRKMPKGSQWGFPKYQLIIE